jgi:pyruvate,orthophosphate dikinase
MGGEHDSDPSSVEFCHLVGMDYMSCSPFRFPIARLAGAQAVVKEKKKEERRKRKEEGNEKPSGNGGFPHSGLCLTKK